MHAVAIGQDQRHAGRVHGPHVLLDKAIERREQVAIFVRGRLRMRVLDPEAGFGRRGSEDTGLQ
jgi:hypothetical protein